MKHGIIIAGSGRGLYFADLLARTPGLKESCSVKAVVDIRKENHDALRTRLNESGLTETKILTTLPEALEALPCKEAQSVLIVTPNTTHAELAEQSLRAGRHLLLENGLPRSSPTGSFSSVSHCVTQHSTGKWFPLWNRECWAES